jgi:membrane-associated phospholipid phosphatase
MKSTRSFVKSYFEKLPLRIAILLVIFIGALFLFVYVVHEVLWEKEEAVDHSIFDFLSRNVINEQLTPFMKTVTHMASATFLQISYGVLFLVYVLRKNVKRAFEIAAIGLGGFVVNYFMKLSFQRTRPPDPLIEPLQNFSFPSGHATSAFIFYGLLAYLVWKTELPKSVRFFAGVILLLISLIIGFSRVYLRLHYPSDVVGGFCIGLAWLLVMINLFEYLKKKTAREQRQKQARN